MERRDNSIGYCAPEVHHPCQSLSKCVLWSSAVAPQIPSPMVEEGDLFNMEKETLGRGLEGPMVPTSSERPHHQCPEWRNLPALLHLTLHLHPIQTGLCHLRSWPWCQEGGHCHPQVCSSGLRQPQNATSRRCICARGYAHGNPVGSHCLIVTTGDCITYTRNWGGPLPPSGPEHHQDVPARHFLLGTT